MAVGFNFNNMRQQAQIAFTTMLGSGEKARSFLNELQIFASKTPFEFPELVSASQKLLAMGFSAEKVIPTLTSIGDAVAGLGGGGPLIDQVTRALGQMQAKGKASAEEMLQLTEAGIPAWQFLADAIGTDVKGAMEAVSKGAVDSDTAISALVDGMNNKFGGLMEKQSHTFGGLLSTLKDTFQQVSGAVMMPFFEMATGGMQQLVDLVGSEGFLRGVQRMSDAMSRGMAVIQESLAGLVSEGGALNIFATRVAMGLGVERGSERLMGFRNTVVSIFQELGERVTPVLENLGAIFMNSVLPAVAAVAGAFGLLLQAAMPLLGLAWNVFETLAGFFAENEIAAKALMWVLAGLLGLAVVNSMAGWAYSIAGVAGSLSNLSKKLASTNLGKLFDLGQKGKDVCAEAAEKVKCVGDEATKAGQKAGGGLMAGLAQSLGVAAGPMLMAARPMIVQGVGAMLAAASAALSALIPLLFNPITLAIIGVVVAGFLIYKYRDQIMEGLSKVGEVFMDTILPALETGFKATMGALQKFFTETMPDAIVSFFQPENLGARLADLVFIMLIGMFPIPILIIKFREQIAGFFEAVGGAFVDFLTETLPGFIGDHWQDILLALFPVPMAIIRWHEEIGDFASAAGQALVNLVTDTLPNFIGDHWKDILLALFPMPVAFIRFRTDIFDFGDQSGSAFVDLLTNKIPQAIGDHWREIVTALFPPLALVFFREQISGALGAATETILGWIGDLASGVGDKFKIWDWVKAAWDAFLDRVGEWLNKIWGGSIIEDWISGLGSWLTANMNPWEWVKAAFELLKDMIGLELEGIKIVFGEWPGKLAAALGDLGRTLWQKGVDLIAGLAGGVWERAQATLAWFGELPTMLLNRIGNVAGIFYDVGWALIKGIADGVAAAWDFFKDEILGKADPHNWDIPGRSPFIEAYEHTGREAGEALTRGISQGISGISTAGIAGALGGLAGIAGGAGFSLGEGLKLMLGQAFGEEGLGGMLKELRDVVRGLHGEMSRLLGLPTVESAEEQLRLAELELQRFQLEEQAAAERADRELQLAILRDRLASEEAGRQGLLTRLELARQEQNVALVAQLEEQLRQDDLRIASIREEIAITTASLGSAEMKIASIDRETEAIKRLAEERQLENAVLEARALAADQTLLSDAEMKKAAEEWIKQIAAGTSAIEAQVGDIWTQFIPALEAIEKQQAANAAAAEDARRRETQAFIDAIEAQIAAAQQAAALAAAIAAGGGLGAIGVGMQGETLNARLARSLQAMGGQAFSLFLAAAAEGLPTEQILRNFFGQGGLFADQLGELSTLLMSEGIRLAPDFSLTDLIAEAQELAETMNQTASGAITSMAQSVTTAVAPITTAVQDFVATGATFLADSTGIQQAELERRLRAEQVALDERLGKQYNMADYVVRNHMRVTDQLLAAVAGASRMISLFERAMLTVLRKAEAALGTSLLPSGGLGQVALSSLAPSAGMAPIVIRSGSTIDISQAVTASESNLPALRNAMRMMNIELSHSIQNTGGI